MKPINKKRGQMGNLTSGILALVVAVIVLVMGIVVVQEIRDADVVDQAESSSFTNETVTSFNEAGDNLACNSNPSALCSVTTVSNSSGGEVVPTTNFTATNCNLVSTAGLYNGTDVNVTYSCTFGGEAFTSGNASLVGLGDFADFVPIIVIALAASIIIGLILVGFAFSRRTR